ncbi:DUF1294 domain-containing protein [Moraxella nasibovis]|uniref:DUF1294 domain-containing protein n=1 Tax=Moraxella nasibovis TaxID=2904120 RepID=UPI0024102FCD|nr:DUF1294 domain-containing protein [Moraxella nasibovis]WFF38227.1 DUF1294 domain-containing protein [Moraxella nasibovis]
MSKNNSTLNFICGFAIFYMLTLIILVALGKFPKLIVSLYFVASITSFMMYYVDKDCAIKGRYRIPENQLLLADILGGWFDGSFAHKLLNHKSTKLEYRLLYYGTINRKHFI